MSNGVNKENILQMLPTVLANDAGMQPLGETAAEALAGLWGSVDLPTIFSRLDDLPESMLDIIAKDFKVDWYNFNHPIETKRAVIRDSFFVHKHLGTVGAVKRALSDVWASYSLEEWFQYGGEPYHFRVAIADSDFTVAKREQAIKYINLVKNVRSWCDDIYARVIGDIVIVDSAGWTYVDYLVASEIEYTNANDIGDWDNWEEPEDEAEAKTDVSLVAGSYVPPTGVTVTIPENLTVITEESFSGIAAEVVICPGACTTIESKAFSDCPNLATVIIYATTTSIAADAFENSDSNLTIMTPAGSYAESYAISHGYNVIH